MKSDMFLDILKVLEAEAEAQAEAQRRLFQASETSNSRALRDPQQK